MKIWPRDPAQGFYYLIGIKGTGMTALAELLVSMGARVAGSDVSDVFYTDAILQELQVMVYQGFSPSNVPNEPCTIVHSAAYSRQNHPELIACEQKAYPIFEYSEALGELSRTMDSSGVSGVHGKTTTTAMAGTMVKSLALPASVLVGSGVNNFNGRQTLSLGKEFFIAETCEYRRHFLHFSPRRIILTSVEPDHLDYFKDLEDISQAFVEYALRLPEGGELFYCADDAGALDVARRVGLQRNDIALIPYGFTASHGYVISDWVQGPGWQEFSLKGLGSTAPEVRRIKLQVPGKHNVLNASAALALVISIYTSKIGTLSPIILDTMISALGQFRGTRRRSEIIGTFGGITVVDDYGHHPTAIKTTLEGYRKFWPQRRLVLSFMSHTYSRTQALFEEFAQSFGSADVVILHKIYASAREGNPGGIQGQDLFEKTKEFHPQVHYFEEVLDALPYLEANLRDGDVFITMGAGDNWTLGKAYLQRVQTSKAQEVS